VTFITAYFRVQYSYNLIATTATLLQSLHYHYVMLLQDYPARVSQQVDKNGYWTKGRGKEILQLLEQVTNKVNYLKYACLDS
jgi:hypothetical protein